MKQASRLKAVLLDMDGVLWQGSDPVLDLRLLFDRIQDLGFQAFCVTNNSTRSVEDHLEKLNRLGARLDPFQIITSAEATGEFLEREFPQGGTLFVVGEDGLKAVLKEKGFQVLEEDADIPVKAVVVGLDRSFTYQDLEMAVRSIYRGALFVGTNPDLTIPTPSGPAPGAGTIIRGIEVSSGVKPLIIGKPFSRLYSLALDRADSLPEETLMIGDRLETDILGAQQMGLKTAVVLSGIATRDQAEAWEPAPDIIAEDALKVIEIIGNAHE